MKIRSTSSFLSLLVLAFVTLGAMQAQAIIIICRPPIGITTGQTLRITTANISDRAIIIIGGKFLDNNGIVVGQFGRQVIEAGKMMSFDLKGDNIVRGNSRVQIRVVLRTDTGDILNSIEVFEDATGKTTVLLGGPDT